MTLEHFFSYPSCNLSLDLSTSRFDLSFANNHSDIINNALKESIDLENGAIANLSENRQVGHYWLRNPELAPSKEITALIVQEQIKITTLAEKIKTGEILSESKKQFKHILVIGIGGSALGIRLLATAFEKPNPQFTISFLDNTDANGITLELAKCKSILDQTLVLVISKSGGTTETKNCMLETEHIFEQAKLSFAKHTIAITTKSSELDNYAKSNQWIDSLYLWDWVGGRTSLFSAVGLFPAALLGISTAQLMIGAKEMDILTRNKSFIENPALLLASIWYKEFIESKKSSLVFLPYFDRLGLLGMYMQQLIMESLGKEKTRSNKANPDSFSVFGNKGSTDQHSYIQQLREGKNDFLALFVTVLEQPKNNIEIEENITSNDYLHAFYLGTKKALHDNNRNSLTIQLDQFNEKSLGALIALFERAVSFYATFLDINAYDQPGVQAGKTAAKEFIELTKNIKKIYAERRNITFDELIKNFPNEDHYALDSIFQRIHIKSD